MTKQLLAPIRQQIPESSTVASRRCPANWSRANETDVAWTGHPPNSILLLEYGRSCASPIPKKLCCVSNRSFSTDAGVHWESTRRDYNQTSSTPDVDNYFVASNAVVATRHAGMKCRGASLECSVASGICANSEGRGFYVSKVL